MSLYLVVDIRQKGADGESEGVLRFVGESKGEDVPGSTVGDHLVLDVAVLVGLRFGLRVHNHQKNIKVQTDTLHNPTLLSIYTQNYLAIPTTALPSLFLCNWFEDHPPLSVSYWLFDYNYS